MKKLISTVVILAILFALLIWPLDIFKLDLMDTIFGAGTQQKVEETAGFTKNEARDAGSDVAHGIGEFFSDLGDTLSN